MTGQDADLIVVGAGPAGMAAACEARKNNLSVILLDEQHTPGGQIYRNVQTAPKDRLQILGKDYEAGRNLASEFIQSGTDYRLGCSVWNVTRDGTVDYVDDRARTVAGKFVLLASGAMERPFPVEGWTLPGVMGAGAAQIMLKGAGALPRGPVVLAGCGPLLYLLAWQYLRAGAQISAVVDTTELAGYLRAIPHSFGALAGWRDLSKGLKLIAALRRSGVPIHSNARNLAITGQNKVDALSFSQRGKQMSIPASLVLLHQGVVPNTQLSLSTGLEHRWNKSQLCWHPLTDDWGRMGDTSLYVAGDSRAIVGALASAAQGRLAALAIARNLGAGEGTMRRVSHLKKQVKSYTRIRPFLDALYRPLKEHRIPIVNEVTVCRCEEVTAGDIRGYVELGCLGPNQTKSFGRCGMGPCQGRFCSLTVTEMIAEERGVGIEDVGHYRIRPPVKPIRLGDFVE